ncbi:asparaginase domain-containing protein, partial [Flavobacterium sp. UBA4854]
MKTLLTLLLSVLLFTGVYAQKLPRIKVLATGGTIAGKGASADRSAYKAGELPIKDLIGAVPGIEKIADITG